jgi:Ran GTPase-activating protein (RanGAP) involved in mRNA processing and transport
MWVDKKKRNKVQKRLIVVGLNRIFSLKPGGKVAREGHMLDLVEVKSNDPKELEIIFKTFAITCSSSTDSMDDMISSIRRAYFYNFSNLPEESNFKLNVPSNRLVDIPPADFSSCGNFIPIYRSLCDYYHTPVHEDLCWDAENLFERENLKSLNLSKFGEQYEEPLTQLEMLPIFHALRHNTYFTSLIIKNFKLEKQAFITLTELLKVNSTLHSLTFSDINGPKELYLSLFDSLVVNSYCSIISLDFSNTQFEEKPLLSLAVFLKKSMKRIIYLDLNNTGITPKAMSAICSALVENKHIELEHLALSNNKLSNEGSASLGQYLSTESVVGSLRYLYLAGASLVFKPLLDALIQGKSPLKVIDLSNNKLYKEDISLLSDYLQHNSFLEELNLSFTQLASESLEKLLLSFHQDVYISLDISNNAFGVTGAKIISKIAYKLNNIYTLDLSDTDIGDDGMAEMLYGFKNNYYIKRLYLNRNFKGSKTKSRTTAINNLIKMISSDCTIEGTIHIKVNIYIFIN